MSQQTILKVLLILVSSWGCICHAQKNTPTESIRELFSTITINQDASIDVTEKIVAYANQDKIRHGLSRWLPVHYMDSHGLAHNTHYQIRSIQVNGKNSSYTIEKSNHGVRIYIGERNTIIDPGLYTYIFKYHITNALSFLRDRDELFWNITGNSWDFPVDKVTATLHLPNNAPLLQQFGYTGKVGNQGKDFSTDFPSKNQIVFTTTKPLSRGIALAVTVSWPKGFVQLPVTPRKTKPPIEENLAISMSIDLGLIVLCYLLIRWYLQRKSQYKKISCNINHS